jgi:hypothetical protein
LLFLPTQFAWSLSALKEPFYFLTMSIGLAAAVAVARPGPWPARMAAIALVGGSALVAQSVREGGLAMAGGGAAAGLLLGALARRPKLIVPLTAICVLAVLLVASHGAARDRAVATVRQAASKHWNQVNTPGYVYTILDRSFYARSDAVADMTFRQGVRYIGGALVAYLTVPLPWTIQSRTALLYLPEQVVWYLLLVLLPFGVAAGVRRDAQLTALLAAYSVTAAVLVAVASGNVGTLVRHRGLALPYLLWFSVLGACEVVALLTASRQELHAHHR